MREMFAAMKGALPHKMLQGALPLALARRPRSIWGKMI
jgi:hypothetical protein